MEETYHGAIAITSDFNLQLLGVKGHTGILNSRYRESMVPEAGAWRTPAIR